MWVILQSHFPSYNYQQDKSTYYDCWITLQIAFKIAASNLYCKITLIWLDSSLSVHTSANYLKTALSIAIIIEDVREHISCPQTLYQIEWKGLRFLVKNWFYAVLWLVFKWSPYPWSPVEITPLITTFFIKVVHTGVIFTKSSEHRGDLHRRSRMWRSRENKP